MKKYISDTHFGYDEIRTYCQRPFATVSEMDAAMWEAIQREDQDGTELVHAGDWSFRPKRTAERPLLHPERHALVVGNHDHGLSKGRGRKWYATWFARIYGERGQWRTNHVIVSDLLGKTPVKVLVSHRPQEDLRGCQYNVYGHVHNNLYTKQGASWQEFFEKHPGVRQDPDQWVVGRARYLNACVEVVGYRPRTLHELVDQCG